MISSSTIEDYCIHTGSIQNQRVQLNNLYSIHVTIIQVKNQKPRSPCILHPTRNPTLSSTANHSPGFMVISLLYSCTTEYASLNTRVNFPIFWTLCKWNNLVYSFVSGFFHSASCFQGLATLQPCISTSFLFMTE